MPFAAGSVCLFGRGHIKMGFVEHRLKNKKAKRIQNTPSQKVTRGRMVCYLVFTPSYISPDSSFFIVVHLPIKILTTFRHPRHF